jgi:hypothetical protein
MKRMKTHAAVTTASLLLLALLYSAAPISAMQKLKHKQKEKRFEPVVKERVADYAGRYVGIEPDYYLEIEAGARGTLSITSQEGDRRAALRDIRIDGARLTATRVYADGTTKDFAATFANRILNGVSAFGIVVENLDVRYEGITFNRIFYRLDPVP